MDTDLLIQQIHQYLLNQHEYIAIAESCTGGAICSAYTRLAGTSQTFAEGFVTYSIESKVKTLNIDRQLIEKYGVVSEETAIAMARGAAIHLNSAWGLATTGYAGPTGGTPEAPLGCVCFGLIHRSSQEKIWSVRHIFEFHSRNQVQHDAVLFALQLCI